MPAAKAPPPPPRRETLLVAILLAHLAFLPWALGGVHAWSQTVSLGLALAGFAVALLPRSASRTERAGPYCPAQRLLRFPVFWAGLILLAYIAVQALNPSWRFVRNATSWWLVPIAHVPWLPAGVDAPYLRSNPWRALVVMASLWLLLCSMWMGLLRRQSYRWLFGGLVANGVLLALLGFLQQLSGTTRIFWRYAPSNDQFVSSFIYRNHAGAYFNLITALAAGMTLRHYLRARRRMESPFLTVLFGFAAGCLGVMVVFTYSRMAIALLFVLALLVCGLLAAGHLRGGRSRRDLLAPGLAFMAIIGLGLISLRSDIVWRRFALLVNDPSATLSNRVLARRAGEDMLRSRWLFGWGAGCFRYGFPLFAQHYPTIYYAPPHNLMYWEHVHDDLLEFPIEYGLIGMLPITASLGCAAAELARRRFWRHSLPLCAVFGCILVLGHAWLDFVFQCPAVLLTWAALLGGAVRLAELETGPVRINPRTARTRAPDASSPA